VGFVRGKRGIYVLEWDVIRGRWGIYVLVWGLLGGGLWVCDFLTTKLVMKWEVGVLEVGLWGGLGIALGWGLKMGWVLARGFVWGLRFCFEIRGGGFLGVGGEIE
jgi:hypothetical protein